MHKFNDDIILESVSATYSTYLCRRYSVSVKPSSVTLEAASSL